MTHSIPSYSLIESESVDSKRALRFSIEPMPPRDTLEKWWRTLEGNSEATIFTSWSWIGSWIDTLPSRTRVQLLVGRLEGKIVVLGALVVCFGRLLRWLPARTWMLNRTGEADLDDIMIEHNGLLVDRALPDSAIRDAIAFVLRLPGPGTLDMGLSHERTFALVNAPPPSTTGSAIPRPSYVVDLQKVRQEPNGYLSLLSANSRHQISRSQREFGKLGTLLVTEAGSLDDARSYFRELLRLHSAAWRERGMSSSFEKQPQVLAFHDHFLNAAFRRGEIQLLRITAGSTTIGYLYNFVFRGRVSYYQAGFNYRVIAHHNRPGLVCHALAIMHNAAAGKMCYDFLAGEHRYKQTLSTDREWQAFCLFRRNSPIARLDGWLRRWRRGRRHLEVVAGAGLCISLVGLSLLE